MLAMGSLPVMVTAPDLAAALSYEQWLALPEDRARHAELLDGRLVAKFPKVEIGEVAGITPGRRHQQLVLALGAAIRAWAREAGGRGEVTLEPPVRIADDRAYLPDLAWYPEVAAGAEQYDGVPALVVEVLSPTTRAFDVLRKTADYAKAGVEELWLVDPGGPPRRCTGGSRGSASTVSWTSWVWAGCWRARCCQRCASAWTNSPDARRHAR